MNPPDHSPPDWSAALAADETLIWSGRPKPGILLNRGDFGIMIFGLPFLTFGLTATIGTLHSLVTRPLPEGVDLAMIPILLAFGITFTGIGLFLMVYLWWHRERMLQRTFYALVRGPAGSASAGRALIFVAEPQMKRQSWPITAKTILDDIAHPRNGTASILLADYIDTNSDGDRVRHRTGFERLSDADRVFRLVREIQIASQTPTEVQVPE